MQITIGELATILGSVVAIISGCEFLIARIKKILDKQLEPIKKELQNEKISRMKCDLVNFQSLAEQGLMNETQKAIYYEMYDQYRDMGLNHQIKENHDRLVEKGKLHRN